MRLPIQYALTYPDRIHLNEDRLDLFKQPLEFFEPDLDKFRCLALAFEANKEKAATCRALSTQPTRLSTADSLRTSADSHR